MSILRNVNTNHSNGVPPEYTKQTASGGSFLIQKGQANSLRLRPQIRNEHAESSRVAQATVDTDTIVGQIFKASQDNINGISLSMESAAGVVLDDFEGYANEAALQAVWVETGGLAGISSIVYEGNKAMVLDAGTGSVGDEWENTFAETDFTDYTGQFQLRSNKEYSDVQMRVFVRDSLGNTSSREVVQTDKDLWTHIVIDVNSLVADGATAADLSKIVGIGFRVEKEKKDGVAIIDYMISVPPPGSVVLKLWDMGSTLPESGVDILDNASQYSRLGDLGISGAQLPEVPINLLGGKRFYQVNNFVAGVAREIPSNELLTVGNYYAITIHYVDTDVTVYGPNESWDDYYANGYAFTASDEYSEIEELGSQIDLCFLIFSTQDVYVTEMTQVIDAAPGSNSETTLYIEDENMKRSDILLTGVRAIQVATQTIERPFVMNKGSKFEQEYNDDITDSVSAIDVIFQYRYVPPTVNG